MRIYHGRDQFARGTRHINGIESFRGYAKRRLAKFNGVPDITFYLHLKETEYRFNYRRGELFVALIKMLKKDPLWPFRPFVCFLRPKDLWQKRGDSLTHSNRGRA